MTEIVLNCLFERFADDLDFQTCLYLALTCRSFSNAWADFVMRDLPRRLVRVYRGISLRHAITLLRMAKIEPDRDIATRLLRIPPPMTPHDTDEQCLAETIYFGLAATSDELQALCATQMMRETTANELLTVSRMHMHQPHLVPATQIQALVPRGDQLIEQWQTVATCPNYTVQEILTSRKPISWWTLSVRYGPRIIMALHSLLTACNGAIESALAQMFGFDDSVHIVQQALCGYVHAMPYIVAAYVRAHHGKIIPRLIPELFDANISLTHMSQRVDENRASVAAAVLLHARCVAVFCRQRTICGRNTSIGCRRTLWTIVQSIFSRTFARPFCVCLEL